MLGDTGSRESPPEPMLAETHVSRPPHPNAFDGFLLEFPSERAAGKAGDCQQPSPPPHAACKQTFRLADRAPGHDSDAPAHFGSCLSVCTDPTTHNNDFARVVPT